MSVSESEIEETQKILCVQNSAPFVASPWNSKTGFAASTRGLVPVNGLRHPPQGETSGWYIWCGESFSDAPDFFVPLHTYHLYEDYPQIARFMGLSPGHRFLVAADFVDVWFDEALLCI